LRFIFAAAFLALSLDSKAYAREFTPDQLATLKEGFRYGITSEKLYRARLEKEGVPTRLIEPLVEHQSLLFKNEDVTDRFFNEMLSAGFFSQRPEWNDEVATRAQSFGTNLNDDLAMKGLRRLETSDQRTFLSLQNGMYTKLTPNECRLVLNEDALSSQQQYALGMHLLTKLSDNDVNLYLTVFRRAILAEVRNHPAVRTVSEPQRAAAEDAFATELDREITAHAKSQAFARSKSSDSANSDSDASCDSFLLPLSAMLKMKGAVAEWQIRLFVDAMQ